MSFVTPVMAVLTAILSLVFDPWDELRENNYFDNPGHVGRSLLLMLFGGTLAFFMVGEYSNFSYYTCIVFLMFCVLKTFVVDFKLGY